MPATPKTVTIPMNVLTAVISAVLAAAGTGGAGHLLRAPEVQAAKRTAAEEVQDRLANYVTRDQAEARAEKVNEQIYLLRVEVARLKAVRP